MAIKLNEFDRQYTPQSSIKGQALVDFVTEWIEDELVVDPNIPFKEAMLVKAPTPDLWMVYVDGACNSKSLGVRITIFTSIRELIEQYIWIAFPTINNVVEYVAHLLAFRQLHSLELKKVLIYNDSRLIANQVNNTFEAKEKRMKEYLEETKKEI